MTSPKHYERLHEVFASACKLPREKRASVLDRQCADDPQLRSEVEALLADEANAREFLESPVLGSSFSLEDVVPPGVREAALVGERIGRYELTRVIATGGMGTVYEATQEKPHRSRLERLRVRPPVRPAGPPWGRLPSGLVRATKG